MAIAYASPIGGRARRRDRRTSGTPNARAPSTTRPPTHVIVTKISAEADRGPEQAGQQGGAHPRRRPQDPGVERIPPVQDGVRPPAQAPRVEPHVAPAAREVGGAEPWKQPPPPQRHAHREVAAERRG